MANKTALAAELSLPEYDGMSMEEKRDHYNGKTVDVIEPVDPFDLYKHIPLEERERLRVRYPSVFEEIQHLLGQTRPLDISTTRIQGLFSVLQSDGAAFDGINTFSTSTVSAIAAEATITTPLSREHGYGDEIKLYHIQAVL